MEGQPERDTRAASAARAVPPHAVVIGAGFGGLAAAVRLGARGYRVTVVDKLDGPGGRAEVHRQDGFTFDAGPTVITAPFLLEELWALCGRRIEDDIDMRPVTPFYRIRFDDGAVFDYTGDAEVMRREVARFAPGDVAGYQRLLEKSEAIYRIGFEQLAHQPFGRITDMARIVPDMVRLESWRTVWGLVSRHIADPRLRQVLSFHRCWWAEPLLDTSIYALIASWSAIRGALPIGGTGASSPGGALIEARRPGALRHRVRRITLRGRRAVGVDAAARSSRRRGRVQRRRGLDYATWWRQGPAALDDRRIERSRFDGLFVWYFGTRRTWPEVAHHTICRPAVPRAARRHLRAPRARRGLQPLPARPRPPTRPWRRPAATPSTCCTGAEPGKQDGLGRARGAVSGAIEAHLEATVSRPRRIGDHFAVTTPLDSSNAPRFRGAAFGFERCCSRAPGRPNNESEDIGASISSARHKPRRRSAGSCLGACSRSRGPMAHAPLIRAAAAARGAAGGRDVGQRDRRRRGSALGARSSGPGPRRAPTWRRAGDPGSGRGASGQPPAASRARARADIALYAFCRVADDEIDRARPGRQGRRWWRWRNACATSRWAGPRRTRGPRAGAGADRARAAGRPVPGAARGLRWDVERRRYTSLAELRAYAARVAATVGRDHDRVMGRRDAVTLARACDLGGPCS